MNAAQPSLFGIPPRGTFDNVLDGERTKNQREKVEALMSDGVWRTLEAICAHIGALSEAGASARLRDLRKKEYGGYTIERKRITKGGLHVYRMVKP